MNLEQLTHFASAFGIHYLGGFHQLPKTTSGNDSYVLVTVNNDRYVLRTLSRQSIIGATEERSLQLKLREAGVVCPVYMITSGGDIVVTIHDISAVMSQYIPGARQDVDTLQLAGAMASMLATIHTALTGIELTPNRQQWFNLENVDQELSVYTGPDLEFIRKNIHNYARIFEMDLPKALTHGDFHTHNVFSEQDTVTAVFDFESAEYTIRILDLARLYLTYIKVTDLNPYDVLRVIVEHYSQSHPTGLTAEEISELPHALIYVALVSSVSIHNHGNEFSSKKYFDIAKRLIRT